MYQEKIIKFMKGKAERLNEYDIDIEYINNDVLEIIRQWDDESAEYVWGDIEHSRGHEYLWNLTGDECPFCVLQNKDDYNCKECGYTKVMNNCTDKGSTWNKIQDILRKRDPESKEIFTKEFYNDLVDKINCKLMVK
jgi:hypothetical protein